MWTEVDDQSRPVVSPSQATDRPMRAVWVLYAVVLIATAGLYAEVGPTRVLLVVAMAALIAAVVQLVREAVRS